MTDVLYLGHSLVNHNIPAMVRDLAPEGTTVQEHIVNGAPLEWLWNNPTVNEFGAYGVNVFDALATGTIDVFIMTEGVPISDTAIPLNSAEYAADFYNTAMQYNNQTQVYLYETWSDIRSGTGVDVEYDSHDDIPWRERLDQDLSLWQGIVDAVNAQRQPDQPEMKLIPAGQAMANMYDAIEAGLVPGIDDISDLFIDTIHLNDLGLYYISQVHYATIFGENPAGNSTDLANEWGTPYTDLPSGDLAAFMQQLAWDTVTHYPGLDVGGDVVPDPDPTPLPDPDPGPVTDPGPDPTPDPDPAPAPEPGSTVKVAAIGDVIDDADNVLAGFGDATGIIVVAASEWSALGREHPGDEVHIMYQVGAEREFGGRTVEADYWSLEENRDGPGGAVLAGSATDAARSFGAVVLNASVISGTSAGDQFYGRDGNEVFAGGGGDDWIFGGGGTDTARFSGVRADYDIHADGLSVWVQGADGSDYLYNVELLQFDDGTWSAGDINDPLSDPVAGPDPSPPSGPDPDPEPDPVPPPDPVSDPDPVPSDDVIVASIGQLIDGAGTVRAGFGEQTGVIVVAASEWSALGREHPGDEVHIIHPVGAEMSFGGLTVQADYWSLEEDRAGSDGATLAGSATDAALTFGAVVINAGAIMGTSASDQFYGRDGNDVFMGAGGDDWIFGGGGEDTARFSGTRAGYEIQSDGLVVWVSGADGTDYLKDIEFLQFDDGTWSTADVIGM